MIHRNLIKVYRIRYLVKSIIYRNGLERLVMIDDNGGTQVYHFPFPFEVDPNDFKSQYVILTAVYIDPDHKLIEFMTSSNFVYYFVCNKLEINKMILCPFMGFEYLWQRRY